MIQLEAYKLLYVSEETILDLQSDIKDENWTTPMTGLSVSFDWVLGHYAAVEDWFLHHLNGDAYELPQKWQDTYWADTTGLKPPAADSDAAHPSSADTVPPANGFGRAAITAGFQATRQRLYSALKFDLFHLNRCVKPGFFPVAVKTRGDAWLFVSAHAYWHLGELDALRAMMGYRFKGTKGIHH